MQWESAQAFNARTRVPFSSSDTGANDTAFFRQVIEASATPIAVFKCNTDEQLVTYVNPAFERCLGYAAEYIVGCDWRVLCSTGVDEDELLRASAAIEAGEEIRIALRGYASGGCTLWYELHVGACRNSHGPHDQRVAVLRDITAERTYLQELEHRACFDALTGLPNRHVLHDRLEQAVAHVHRTGERFAVALVDIDCFKCINDTWGHHAGDEVLRQISGRLTRSLRHSDTVARLGGDEFVLILNPLNGSESAAQVMSRLTQELQQTVRVDGQDLTISCSIGVSVYPEHGLDETALLRNADQAMYEDKAQKRSPETQASAVHSPLQRFFG